MDELAITCEDEENLLQQNILSYLSIIKNEINDISKCINIRRIDCYMTPLVKKNIIMANKKLAMYGKEKSSTICFDEYGRVLSEKTKINTQEGMIITILDDPDTLYLSFKIIEDKIYDELDDDFPF